MSGRDSVRKGTKVNLNVRVNREERRVKQHTWYDIGCVMNYTHSSARSLYDMQLSYIAFASTSHLIFIRMTTLRHVNTKPYWANILGDHI